MKNPMKCKQELKKMSIEELEKESSLHYTYVRYCDCLAKIKRYDKEMGHD